MAFDAITPTVGGLASSKECRACREVKPHDAFTPSKAAAGGLHPRCKACRAKEARERYAKNPEAKKAYNKEYRARNGRKQPSYEDARCQQLRLKYGITNEEFQNLLKAQDGRCALCSTDRPGGRYRIFVVDHCHETGRVRGLLCHGCNVALGRLGDNPESIMRALAYVKGGAA